MTMEAPAAGSRSAAGFRFIPDDARQALRMQRFFIAAGTSCLVPLVLTVAAALRWVEFRVAGWGAVMVGALIALFYAIFRSGFNLRFRDHSLTGEMILAAILCVAYLSYHVGEARPEIAMFYLVALLFGALRLGAARLFGLAVIALLAHGVVLWIWHQRHPGADAAASLMQIAALAVILPWFAAMGAYVNRLRTRLSGNNRQLTEAVERIKSIAARDELTGLYNRRFLLEFLGRETARTQRSSGAFSICLIDIDEFKSVNDSFGHAAGDAVLKHFGAVAGAGLRSADILGRLGGEEFLVVLPDTDIQGAINSAERIRRAVEAITFTGLPAGRQVTVTAGVACSMPSENSSVLMARADRALYEGKAAGKNTVVAAG
jgi:diguanylate cyclase (GGDEF)-like protein